MAWDFEIPHTSNNELSDIEVGALYKIKQWKPVSRRGPNVVQRLSAASFHSKISEKLVIPLKRLTYNMNTGDTELTVLMDNNIRVLPGWMLGHNGGLLEKIN